ncbi:hypothetical protein QBC45DRAFT_397413 [Copromyces sp. CBS 386.78]|nr:hypothetical protein QBC45DRAFT_397413 [Copromyces sp. CBS 386.78]
MVTALALRAVIWNPTAFAPVAPPLSQHPKKLWQPKLPGDPDWTGENFFHSKNIDRLKASAGSFEPHLPRVYHLLNERYARLPSSPQVDLARAVYYEIDSIVNKIVGIWKLDDLWKKSVGNGPGLEEAWEMLPRCNIPLPVEDPDEDLRGAGVLRGTVADGFRLLDVYF